MDLIARNQQLVMAAWGLTADFQTETPGRCLLVNLATEEIQSLTPTPLGSFSAITPKPTEWWLRPVIRAARVGQQSAVENTRL